MLLDAKIIATEVEKEIFIDQASYIEVDSFKYPDQQAPHFECLVALTMGRIRNEAFYGREKLYFGVRTTEDLKSVTVFDPESQSIFAARYGKEEKAVVDLIHYILIDSPIFKQTLKDMLKEIEAPDLKAKLLEKLLTLKTGDFKVEQKQTVTT